MKRIFVIMFLLSTVFLLNAYGFSDVALQEAIHIAIIEESAKHDLNYKLIALAYIEDDLGREDKNTKIIQILEFIYVDTMENYRGENDSNEVRQKAAKYLGSFMTEEAEKVLMYILKNDNDGNVIVSALRSLINIANNYNDETIVNIVDCFNRIKLIDDTYNQIVALATIDALGVIARRNNIILDPYAMGVLFHISLEAEYARELRTFAIAESEYWLSVFLNRKNVKK